jgi:glycine C-acetyltransferase
MSERSLQVFQQHTLAEFLRPAGRELPERLELFQRWWDGALASGYAQYSEPLETAPDVLVQLAPQAIAGGQVLLSFASYNYLGLATRPEVKAAAVSAIERYGLGAGASPILAGTFDVHDALMEELAAFKGQEAALLFPSGYAANVGVLSALLGPSDVVLLDQFSHASLVDGATLSRAKVVFFRHDDAGDLERKLRLCSGRCLVVVEGVYSMDGDVCALPELVEVSRRHGARILLDEAHSSFLFGAHGRGVAEHFGLEREVDFHVGTLSKTLGGVGGFVCGPRALVTFLNVFARSRFFSTHLPPAIAAGLRASLEIVRREPDLRARLWRNVAHLKSRLRDESLDFGASASQIVPLMVGDEAAAFRVAERVRRMGIYVHPVVFPAVTRHRARLRLNVSAEHTEAQLDRAARVIAQAMEAEGLLRVGGA